MSQGDCGSSVTSLPTEFSRRRHNDTAPITVELEHLTFDEMAEKIFGALADFRREVLPENVNIDLDDDMRVKLKEGYEILQALFGHQPQLGQSFLRNMAPGGEEDPKRTASVA